MKFIRRAIPMLMLALLACSSAAAHQEEALEAHYYFFPDCPHCASVVPFIIELSKAMPVRGFVYGIGDAEPMPFEVRKAGREILRRFDVHIFPTLVIVKNGEVKQMLSGEQDIKDARAILSAFRRDAWSVSELIEKAPRKTYTVTGWVVSRGEYVKNADRPEEDHCSQAVASARSGQISVQKSAAEADVRCDRQAGVS